MRPMARYKHLDKGAGTWAVRRQLARTFKPYWEECQRAS